MGAKKAFPAFADDTIELHDIISVSAGQRGLQTPPQPRRLSSRHKGHPRRPDQGGSLSFWNHVWQHLQKDLRIEWRSRDAINGMLFFALLVVVVFSLAFDPTANPTMARQISGGILWVAILFATTTALNQTWTREQRNAVLEAQRMAPSPASALFCRQSPLANLIFVGVIEVVLAPPFHHLL